MRSVVIVVLILLALVLQACHSYRRHDHHTLSPTAAAGPVEGRPTLGQATPIPGRSTVLVPFAVESVKGLFEDRDPYTRGGISYDYHQVARLSSVGGHIPYLGGNVRWHNALFRDLKTGEQWPILTRRGIIGQWQVMLVQPEPNQPAVSRAIVFIAVLEDTNRDGMLNDLDARVAILADPDGRNPRIVTPANAQVWSVSFDAEKDAIFLQVVTDTSGDGVFDFKDLVVPYMISTRGQGMAERILSEQLVREIEQHLAP